MITIDEEKLWNVEVLVKVGDIIKAGDIYAKVQETSLIEHRLMVPPGINGRVVFAEKSGSYNIEHVLARLETEQGLHELKMYQLWPVRDARPVSRRNSIERPLITGQRIIDSFFPLAKGGTAAIPEASEQERL